MKHTEAWLKSRTSDPELLAYIGRLKEVVTSHRGQFAELNARVKTAEKQVRDLDRELTRARRELQEARSR